MLTGIEYLDVLVVQRSLAVLQPRQAFHSDIICGRRKLLAIFPMLVAYRAYYISMYVQKKQVSGEVSLTSVTSSANGWFP